MWRLHPVLIAPITWLNFPALHSLLRWMTAESEIKLTAKLLITNSELIEIESVFTTEAWNFTREPNAMRGLETVEDVTGPKNPRSWRAARNPCWRKRPIPTISPTPKRPLVGISLGLEKYFILKSSVHIGGVFFLNGGCESWSLSANVAHKHL